MLVAQGYKYVHYELGLASFDHAGSLEVDLELRLTSLALLGLWISYNYTEIRVPV